jgi:hypothetical protein
MRSSVHGRRLVAALHGDRQRKEREMNTPDATYTNGRYELPPHAHGVLVLADPPEAGWRIQNHSKTPATRATPISRHGRPHAGRRACGRGSR